jgi:hypothetical protein
LKMRLANQGGPVAIGSKLSDKRVGAGGEGSIVEDDTMRGGHPAGHDRRAVGIQTGFDTKARSNTVLRSARPSRLGVDTTGFPANPT